MRARCIVFREAAADGRPTDIAYEPPEQQRADVRCLSMRTCTDRLCVEKSTISDGLTARENDFPETSQISRVGIGWRADLGKDWPPGIDGVRARISRTMAAS